MPGNGDVFDGVRYFSRAVDFPEGDPKRELLLKLDEARDIAGIPFIINSGFRPGDPKSHGRGYAADIKAIGSRQRFLILRGLILAGFHRIGDYPRHYHADCDPSLPPEVCWRGKYKKDAKSDA